MNMELEDLHVANPKAEACRDSWTVKVLEALSVMCTCEGDLCKQTAMAGLAAIVPRHDDIALYDVADVAQLKQECLRTGSFRCDLASQQTSITAEMKLRKVLLFAKLDHKLIQDRTSSARVVMTCTDPQLRNQWALFPLFNCLQITASQCIFEVDGASAIPLSRWCHRQSAFPERPLLQTFNCVGFDDVSSHRLMNVFGRVVAVSLVIGSGESQLCFVEISDGDRAMFIILLDHSLRWLPFISVSCSYVFTNLCRTHMLLPSQSLHLMILQSTNTGTPEPTSVVRMDEEIYGEVFDRIECSQDDNFLSQASSASSAPSCSSRPRSVSRLSVITYTGRVTRHLGDGLYQLDGDILFLLGHAMPSSPRYGAGVRVGAMLRLHNVHVVYNGDTVLALAVCAHSTLEIVMISDRTAIAHPFNKTKSLLPYWFDRLDLFDAAIMFRAFVNLRYKFGGRLSCQFMLEKPPSTAENELCLVGQLVFGRQPSLHRRSIYDELLQHNSCPIMPSNPDCRSRNHSGIPSLFDIFECPPMSGSRHSCPEPTEHELRTDDIILSGILTCSTDGLLVLRDRTAEIRCHVPDVRLSALGSIISVADFSLVSLPPVTASSQRLVYAAFNLGDARVLRPGSDLHRDHLERLDFVCVIKHVFSIAKELQVSIVSCNCSPDSNCCCLFSSNAVLSLRGDAVCILPYLHVGVPYMVRSALRLSYGTVTAFTIDVASDLIKVMDQDDSTSKYTVDGDGCIRLDVSELIPQVPIRGPFRTRIPCSLISTGTMPIRTTLCAPISSMESIVSVVGVVSRSRYLELHQFPGDVARANPANANLECICLQLRDENAPDTIEAFLLYNRSRRPLSLLRKTRVAIYRAQRRISAKKIIFLQASAETYVLALSSTQPVLSDATVRSLAPTELLFNLRSLSSPVFSQQVGRFSVNITLVTFASLKWTCSLCGQPMTHERICSKGCPDSTTMSLLIRASMVVDDGSAQARLFVDGDLVFTIVPQLNPERLEALKSAVDANGEVRYYRSSDGNERDLCPIGRGFVQMMENVHQQHGELVVFATTDTSSHSAVFGKSPAELPQRTIRAYRHTILTPTLPRLDLRAVHIEKTRPSTEAYLLLKQFP